MTAGQIVMLIATILVSGAVSSGLVQLIKDYLPDSNGIRRIVAYVLAVVVALAASYIGGNLLGLVEALKFGSLNAADALAFGTAIWASAEAWYRLWFKVAPADTAAAVPKTSAAAAPKTAARK